MVVTTSAPVTDIRPVRDRAELEKVFDLLQRQLPRSIGASPGSSGDLFRRFPADKRLMVAAFIDGDPVGGALAFRNDDGCVTLRVIGVVDAFRHRGVGRRLVERVETEAGVLGVEGLAVGTDGAVGFWYHLGYRPNLLLQWVYDAELCDAESEAVLGGPLAGMSHRRSAFSDIPQLLVELDEPRLGLRHRVRAMVTGCHVGFMMTKPV